VSGHIDWAVTGTETLKIVGTIIATLLVDRSKFGSAERRKKKEQKKERLSVDANVRRRSSKEFKVNPYWLQPKQGGEDGEYSVPFFDWFRVARKVVIVIYADDADVPPDKYPTYPAGTMPVTSEQIEEAKRRQEWLIFEEETIHGFGNEHEDEREDMLIFKGTEPRKKEDAHLFQTLPQSFAPKGLAKQVELPITRERTSKPGR